MIILKNVYIVRHCDAEGQSTNAKLTEQGFKQAIDLSGFFSEIEVDRIISSPYERAIQSIQPLAKQLNIEIEIDGKLTERVLSTKDISDWKDKLRTSFEDDELKFEGGESSKEARERIVDVVEQIFNDVSENTIIVTHGNLMSLLLNNYNKNFGFEGWQNLTNPDVYVLRKIDNKVTYERLWY
ncbi:histidine phosphatase family protein [Sporosarcina siberiensis]|uniref:Histidine phosphatase family protein n=1 Tax=Sporosarcina siberiensis TaxID=1365606 RepID=A0ABW4SJ08_9BACL